MNLAQKPWWGRLAGLWMVVMTVLLCSCGGGGEDPVPAPTITAAPADQNVIVGSNARFTVTAAGSVSSFQWQSNSGAGWVDIPSATTSVYSLLATDALNATQYRVTVSGAGGAVTSSAARLTVTPAVIAPVITVNPAPVSVIAGANAVFTVTASGTSPTYQWQTSPDGITWASVLGAVDTTLQLTAVTVSDSGRRYRVVVSNSAGTATSDAAALTVAPALAAAAIVTQPVDASVIAPNTAQFSVIASGTPAPTYQWQRSTDGGLTFANIDGATTSTYVTPATAVSDSGTQFRVVVVNSGATVISNPAVLKATAAPQPLAIAAQPSSATVAVPATATFTVAAVGTPTPTYQWQLSVDGGVTFANITGATSATYTTPATTIGDDGKRFRVVMTSGSATLTSSAATLTVTEATLKATSVAAGAYFTCAVVQGGSVYCWGLNNHGQLGDGSNTMSLTPKLVPGLTDAVSISAGSAHVCVTRTDDSLACWGWNAAGQVGDGSTTDRSSPTRLPTAVSAKAVAAGYSGTCYLTYGGTVACWGTGPVGDGTANNRTFPTPLAGLTGAVAIDVGYLGNACATRADGKLLCWGYGDSLLAVSFTPTVVSAFDSVGAFSLGLGHKCAVKPAGTWACWGTNANGRLGDGTTATPADGATTGPIGLPVLALSAGYDSTCALKLDGTVACWGANAYGQLGDGSTTDRLVPTPVRQLTGVSALARGSSRFHECAIGSGGALWCWGDNFAGELGNGTHNSSSVPIRVQGF